MTVATYWNGSAWQEVSGIVGPQGPVGPLGPPTPPTGPAGGDLSGTYPNPGIRRDRVGGLLAVQRAHGNVAGYRAISNGQAFYTDAGLTAVQIQFTPQVDCWWETELAVGLFQKVDAVHHASFVHIILTPADADGESNSWVAEWQHSGVTQYANKRIVRTWRLNAFVGYTAYSWFDQLATGGSFQYYQQYPYLRMVGRAWAR